MMIGKLKKMLRTRKQREQIYCTAKYWDSKAEYLEGDAVSMWANNHLNQLYDAEQARLFAKYLPNLQNLQVLDIGCGTGRITRAMAAKGAQVTGIDFASKAVDIARSYSLDDNPRYFVRSVFEIDDSNTYDVIVSWGVITVACRDRSELQTVFQRLSVALKDGGRVFFLEPIHRGFLHRVLDMDLQEFCQILEAAGFEVQHVQHLHFWVTRLLLCYVQLPRWLTVAGYYLGDWIMTLTNRKAFGDYRAVYAVKRS